MTEREAVGWGEGGERLIISGASETLRKMAP